MNRLRKRLSVMALSAMLLFSLTGCTDYAEWEANRPQGDVTHIDTDYSGPAISDYAPGEGMQTHIDTDYEGPSLIEYVNNGIEDAKDNGLYTETDYSGIMGATNSSGSSAGSSSAGSSSAGSSSAGPSSAGSSAGLSAGNTSEGTASAGNDSTPQDTSDALARERREIIAALTDTDYTGEPWIEVHGNLTYFSEQDKGRDGRAREPFETYSELDSLGRVGTAFANLHQSLMPADDEERGDISSVKPTGWVQAKYDGISNGGWLYNRCHLIAWSLAGENANEKNLMTGTRYFNVEGMLPFELQVLDYLDDNPDSHVLYRAEPVYDGEGLLAKGLLLEASSIEDDGLEFCVYIFNVQPGIEIDYTTGQSRKGE